jgi:hypothetical protein
MKRAERYWSVYRVKRPFQDTTIILKPQPRSLREMCSGEGTYTIDLGMRYGGMTMGGGFFSIAWEIRSVGRARMCLRLRWQKCLDITPVWVKLSYGTLVPRHDGRAGCVALRLADGCSPETFDWRALLEYARSKLPRYAVPIFLRLIREASNTDNQKQNKAPLREEGIGLDKYGSKVVGGAKDIMLWAKPGENRYVRFEIEALEALRGGNISL